MTWTPGPWHAEDRKNILDENGLIVAAVARLEDTRLISLAPEMAELLQAFVELAGSPPYTLQKQMYDAFQEMRTEAQALLARAEA